MQSNLELLDRRAVCSMFGGTKPIHPASLYRGIRQGRYPRPVKVGALSRWLKSECQAALEAMVAGRAS
jgi:predicted DNA-binding transcriptional regulator AlpA